MKGLFIPGISEEEFRSGCLESIEALMAEGYIYDIEYPLEECGDCISRQALIKKAVSWDKHFADSERYVSLTDIQNAPPVRPAGKQKPCEDAISRHDAIHLADELKK